jgi:mycothione reductase
MKNYDVISIGTGSAMNIVSAMVQGNPETKVAVIDKDEPGGICLTRGCIPSKILLYPAELVRTIERSGQFGLDVDLKLVDFSKVMDRMRALISKDIAMIRQGLSHADNLDYYPAVAEFVAPYTLTVGEETITSKLIFLCTGSKPLIPPIRGLDEVPYLTSDTVLTMTQLPERLAIVGGGYIAAEYGHFFSAMGSDVTILGRNPQFLKQEEPEVSALAEQVLGRHMTIRTNHEVRSVEQAPSGEKTLVAVNRATGEEIEIVSDEVLIAAGRASNADLLHPERAGIETDERGWIVTNEYLETSQPNIWAFGDANGRHLFKHVANYESIVVYYNVVLKQKVKVDYHAIPHAVFTYPEIAGVGLGEREAVQKHGQDDLLVGVYKYEDTAKGEAMGVADYFVKVLVQKKTSRIVGAHIIGPYASVLIQEIINLMYTPEQSAKPITGGMHIHPALTEVVERAFGALRPPGAYDQPGHHH